MKTLPLKWPGWPFDEFRMKNLSMPVIENLHQVAWRTEIVCEDWDHYLATAGGHPLQSALWGEARKNTDGIHDHRWAAFLGSEPVWMGRFEDRNVPVLGKVAWMPKGPVISAKRCSKSIHDQFLSIIKEKGYLMLLGDSYQEPVNDFTDDLSPSCQYRTIQVDLTVGKEKLWSGLDKQWRYGVNAASRAGIKVEQTSDLKDLRTFFSLCEGLSKKKDFKLPGHEDLMMHLLQRSYSPNVYAKLFVARYQGEMASGALVLRCGSSLHYFWGASDRKFSKQRASEAVQWAVMEWALEESIQIYDLGGIDAARNSGVYAFKRKMGGREVSFPGQYAYPLNMTGRLALKVGQWSGKL
jgi:hypothetical protein